GDSAGDDRFICRLAMSARPSPGRPQVGDAALQQARQLPLLAKGEARYHTGLDLLDALMALRQQTLTTLGQRRFKDSPDLRVGAALDQTGGLEVGDDAVHRLRGHERPARQLRTAQTWRLLEESQYGVLRGGDPEVPQGGVHGRPQALLGVLEQVSDGL